MKRLERKTSKQRKTADCLNVETSCHTREEENADVERTRIVRGKLEGAKGGAHV